jgi:hypothetical protein
MTRARFETPAAAALYVLGDWDRAAENWTSKAVTLVSERTGTRYTYRVARPPGQDAERPWLVSLLTGQDNENDYTYLGLLRPIGISALVVAEDAEWPLVNLHHTPKSAFAATSAPYRAFGFLTDHVLGRARIPAALQVWHEGRCGRCGRKLTTPESVLLGLGPVCASKTGA